MTTRLKISILLITLAIYIIGTPKIVLADKNIAHALSDFKNPQIVQIKGLPNGSYKTPISTEEPFISRDGRFLFFNTHETENNKDLHFAELIQNQWVYQGPIGPNINTNKNVEGNPSMDSKYNFFHIDSNTNKMVQVSKFNIKTRTLTDVKPFEGVPPRKIKLFAQKFQGNMGVEASTDGKTIFFSRSTWDMNGFSLGKLLGSNILFVKKKNDKYIFNKIEVENTMKNINTKDMEYAASISDDGLELFFTRLAVKDYNAGNIRSKILISRRNSLSEPFSKPKMINAIGNSDFVEGPAISQNSKELYYHKHDGKKFRLYKVTR